jgi:hypothetical protein
VGSSLIMRRIEARFDGFPHIPWMSTSRWTSWLDWAGIAKVIPGGYVSTWFGYKYRMIRLQCEWLTNPCRWICRLREIGSVWPSRGRGSWHRGTHASSAHFLHSFSLSFSILRSQQIPTDRKLADTIIIMAQPIFDEHPLQDYLRRSFQSHHQRKPHPPTHTLFSQNRAISSNPYLAQSPVYRVLSPTGVTMNRIMTSSCVRGYRRPYRVLQRSVSPTLPFLASAFRWRSDCCKHPGPSMCHRVQPSARTTFIRPTKMLSSSPLQASSPRSFRLVDDRDDHLNVFDA